MGMNEQFDKYIDEEFDKIKNKNEDTKHIKHDKINEQPKLKAAEKNDFFSDFNKIHQFPKIINWTESLIKKTFEEPNPDKEDDTALTKGEFDIVKALLTKCPEVAVGKILVDKMVDLAGPGPEGAGGTHLRRCVSEFQKKMDAATGEDQLVIKKKLLNSLERYFYLVCFGAYCRSEGPTNFQKSFVSWLGERSFLEEMVENGIKVWEEMTFFSLNMTLPA